MNFQNPSFTEIFFTLKIERTIKYTTIKYSKGSLVLFVIMGFLSFSCSKDFVPKPKGFPKIDLPAQNYQPLIEVHPYTFEYSRNARIEKHNSKQAEAHWIDVVYPTWRASVQLTYKDLRIGKSKLNQELINDAHRLKSKHEVKAYSIQESILATPNGMTAVVFELEGDVPSQFQFYVSDTNKHFMRGALYFKTATKNDSLKPIIEFIKTDMVHLINTLKWKREE